MTVAGAASMTFAVVGATVTVTVGGAGAVAAAAAARCGREVQAGLRAVPEVCVCVCARRTRSAPCTLR